MLTKSQRYATPVAPEDPDQEYMTAQETAYVLRCGLTWLRLFLKDHPELCGRTGNRGRIVTNREQRTAIHEARSGGDPRASRTIPRQRRRPATRKPTSAAA